MSSKTKVWSPNANASLVRHFEATKAALRLQSWGSSSTPLSFKASLTSSSAAASGSSEASRHPSPEAARKRLTVSGSLWRRPGWATRQGA